MAVLATFNPDSSVVAEVQASPNHGERKDGAKIDMLVLHYTGMEDSTAALRRLCAAQEPTSRPIMSFWRTAASCNACRKRAAPGTRGKPSGRARPTSIRARSASRSPIPDTTTAIRISRARQIAAVTALCRSILTRHRIPPDRVLAPFRRLADTQARSGREVSVAHPAPIRHRALGQAGADRAERPLYVLGDTNAAVARGAVAARPLRLRRRRHPSYLDGATRDALAAFQRHFRPGTDRRRARRLDDRDAQGAARGARADSAIDMMLGLRRFWSQSIRLT